MNASPYFGNHLRDILASIFCLIGLTFSCYFLYLDWKYKTYLQAYNKIQAQEEHMAKENMGLAIESLKNRLHGVLEIKVPFLDIQKFGGTDQAKTLLFPQLFDKVGKQVMQNNPLDSSYQPPLSYNEYIRSNAAHFWTLAYAVMIGIILLLLTNRIVRTRTRIAYGHQMNQLNEELDQLSADRTSLETYNIFQKHLIQRLQMTGVIHRSLGRLSPSHKEIVLGDDKKQALIEAITGLAEGLLSGEVSNDVRERLNLKDILDQIKAHFITRIRKLDLTLQVACPSDLTFMGDPLFTRIVLFNVIGYPLSSLPRQGKMSINVQQEKGFVEVEVRDNRYFLSDLGKQALKFPAEFFIESHHLQHICFQNNVGYHSFQTPEGEFYTRVSFPLTPAPIVTSQSKVLH